MEICLWHEARRVAADKMVRFLALIDLDDEFILACSVPSFDSIQDGSVAAFTPHTAFADPTTPPGTPLRESIELRALVFYDE